MLTDELLAYLFDGRSHLLAMPMAAWLASSRRFTAFATTFRDKIRKKLRTTQDIESLYDLQLELETAYLLLQKRPLSLVYEPQQYGQVRCPDFAVTFTTSLTFMLEVTRLRSVQKATPAHAQTQVTPSKTSQTTALPSLSLGERLADTVCSKLGQLLPQRSNVLLVGIEARLTQSDIHAAMLRLQQRVERNDSTVLQRHRFRDRADFFHHYQRLSEILVRGSQLQADDPVVVWPVAVWVNPQAKHPLPSKVRTVLHNSHTG